MYPAVREVIPNEDFSLNVILENGEKRLLDMKPYLDFGVFKKLREYEKFKRARVAVSYTHLTLPTTERV